MFEETKTKKTAAVLASVVALGLGGATIAGATGIGPGGQSEKANGVEQEAQDNLTGPDANKASAAAEQATGGKATEVERVDASSAKEKSADAADKGEFQTPSKAAYEVTVDKGGKEIDVYLDKGFQVITTHVDTDHEQDSVKGPDANKASAAAEQAAGGKATDVEREDATSTKEKGADPADKGEFQTPSNTAYEVTVDKGGKEIDVYLDKVFQVITTHPDN